MNTEVIIPWRGGCEHREQALAWVLARWSLIGWPVTIAEHTDGPWCKAKAVTPAVQASTADIIVLADADVWSDGITDAVAAVQQGAAWAIPHYTVNRLTEQATAAVLAGADALEAELAERPYKGIEGGGILALPRATYLQVPLDPRIEGWGQEDQAIAIALRSIHGRSWRGTAQLVHLWHPPQPRSSRGVGSDQNMALYRRYKSARQNPDRMRELLAEFTEVTA